MRDTCRVFTHHGGPFDMLAFREPQPGWFEEGELIGIDAQEIAQNGMDVFPEAKEGVDYVYRVRGLTLRYEPVETAIRNANFG